MGRQVLLLLLQPVLAALGGLGGSGAGEWGPLAGRPERGRHPTLQGTGVAGCGTLQGQEVEESWGTLAGCVPHNHHRHCSDL